MSDWKLILGWFVAMTTGCESIGRDQQPIIVMFGEPVTETSNGVTLRYDGAEKIQVTSRGTQFELAANAPGYATISPNGDLLAYNFGSGSGQVYDLKIYAVRKGAPLSVDRFKNAVMQHAKSRVSCNIKQDQISFLIQGWISSTTLHIRTESWSRKAGSEHISRSWKLQVTPRTQAILQLR